LNNWLQRLPRHNFKGTAQQLVSQLLDQQAATAYNFLSVKAKMQLVTHLQVTNTANVTTTGNTVTYCTSKEITSEYIDYDYIGGVSNITGANAGYGNSTT
jgi:hypothetical protein